MGRPAARALSSVLLFALPFVLVACGPNYTPKEVAQEFVKASMAGDVEAASELSTRPLNAKELATIRRGITQSEDKREVSSVVVSDKDVRPAIALYHLDKVEADPPIEQSVIDEQGVSLLVLRKDGHWAMGLPPELFSAPETSE